MATATNFNLVTFDINLTIAAIDLFSNYAIPDISFGKSGHFWKSFKFHFLLQ
jgi:hypothetical protein